MARATPDHNSMRFLALSPVSDPKEQCVLFEQKNDIILVSQCTKLDHCCRKNVKK